MKNLIRLAFILPACFAATTSFAQFSTPNGSNEIHHTGGVGVGISNPVAFFHVYQNGTQTSTASGITIEQDGTGDALLQWLLTSTRRWQMGIDNSNGDALVISEGSGFGSDDHLTINTDGLVGIGTSSPTYRLTINNSDEKHLRFENGNEKGLIRLFADGTFDIWSHDSDAITFSNGSGSGTESMRISSVGKVGINNNNPTYRLDVAGSINGDSYRVNGEHLATSWDRRLRISANTLPSSGEGLEIGYDPASNNAVLVNYSRDSSQYGAMYYNSSSHHFRVSGSDILVVDANGQVGIGTTSPDSELTVNGTVHAKKYQADLNIWPDYVFNDNYNLRSLESTADFIEENHHLPEIPSAAEVKANGIDLAEMNKLLLQKVEEMTLHMIEMKSEINALKLKVEAGN